MNKHRKTLASGAFLVLISFVVYFSLTLAEGKKHLALKMIRHWVDYARQSVETINGRIVTESQFVYWYMYDLTAGAPKSTKIGWISDIHADRFKRRTIDTGTLYPKKYKEDLPNIFDAMRKQGITTVIATGDNTNTSDLGFARDLVRIAHSKNMNVLWVKGNHDNTEVMDALGVNGEKYYSKDIGNTKVVVLDDTVGSKTDYWGGIDEAQMNWLRSVLETDKRVIVAMHIPIYVNGALIDQYTGLEKILKESNNVEAVLSGHLHVRWQGQYDGISYYGENTLTREGYDSSYSTVDLNNGFVDSKFAGK